MSGMTGNAPREAFVEIDGAPVHTATWQPARARDGTPVVLVHGLGGSTINWHLVGRPIADALGVPVTAIDLIGFGRTPLAGRRPTVAANAALLAAYLAQHGPRVVVGNSMGGSTAVHLAARHPDLVDALVLVNPALPFTGTRPTPRAVRNLAVFAAASIPVAGAWMMDARARRIGATEVVDSSLRASRVDPGTMDQELRAALIELAEWRHTNGVAGRAYNDAIRSLLRYLTTAMPADVTAVEAPVLVVHGTADDLVPIAAAHAVSQRRPEWEVAVLPCGHLPLLESPGALVDVVTRWLTGVVAASG
jgi:pimeloyl-ACP methyl ester carboxylesterase